MKPFVLVSELVVLYVSGAICVGFSVVVLWYSEPPVLISVWSSCGTVGHLCWHRGLVALYQPSCDGVLVVEIVSCVFAEGESDF